MIDATIDQAKLIKSIQRYSERFGESSRQAVIRWSVQTCRELALETRPKGKAVGKTKTMQHKAMYKDAYNVLMVASRLKKTGKGYRATNANGTFYVGSDKILNSPNEVMSWINQNRRGSRKSTRKLPPRERKVVQRGNFTKYMTTVKTRAGMAKGGWLGAGMKIAKGQQGLDRINIGTNFIPYAQAHAGMGKARSPIPGFNPTAKITNRAAHSGLAYVLASGESRTAIAFGLKKTISFYRRSINAINKKR